MNLTVAYWAENFLVTPPTLVQHLQRDLSNNNALNYLAKILFYFVISEFFARILFLQIALEDIFATLKNRDLDMI